MRHRENDDVQPEHIFPNPEIQVKAFPDLSPWQVAGMYALRYRVFVQEQQSIFNEHDGYDFDATHLFIEDKDRIVAYARVYKKDGQTASIGRVAVEEAYRGQGLGKQIMAQAIEAAQGMPGISKVDIAAQTYLQKFYESFSFVPASAPYDDDGVMHIDMSLSLVS